MVYSQREGELHSHPILCFWNIVQTMAQHMNDLDRFHFEPKETLQRA